MSTVQWHEAGAGPVVVLLHAFPCDHTMWAAQVEPIVQSGWRVLVPDLPGFGESELPSADPSLGSIVDELAADLADRGIDRFVLAGLSVGGYLAMEWLRRSPEALAGVVLCDTKATEDAPAAREARLAMAHEVTTHPSRTPEILRDRMLGAIVGETSHQRRPDVVLRVRQWMDAAPWSTVAWYQQAMAARVDSCGTLRSAGVPALVVWGREDAMSPRTEQDLMMECLRDATFVTVSEAGHLSAVENPDPVTTALIDFLSAVRGASLQG